MVSCPPFPPFAVALLGSPPPFVLSSLSLFFLSLICFVISCCLSHLADRALLLNGPSPASSLPPFPGLDFSLLFTSLSAPSLFLIVHLQRRALGPTPLTSSLRCHPSLVLANGRPWPTAAGTVALLKGAYWPLTLRFSRRRTLREAVDRLKASSKLREAGPCALSTLLPRIFPSPILLPFSSPRLSSTSPSSLAFSLLFGPVRMSIPFLPLFPFCCLSQPLLPSPFLAHRMPSALPSLLRSPVFLSFFLPDKSWRIFGGAGSGSATWSGPRPSCAVAAPWTSSSLAPALWTHSFPRLPSLTPPLGLPARVLRCVPHPAAIHSVLHAVSSRSPLSSSAPFGPNQRSGVTPELTGCGNVLFRREARLTPGLRGTPAFRRSCPRFR